MSDTSRHLIHLHPPTAIVRPGTSAARTSPPFPLPCETSSARIEALRNLVAAGRYRVNSKWLAQKICRAAGITIED
jgi:hypothetical protein